ncbi:MAG: hypothetical protein NZU63_14965 [Gemmataceae bacterium]|nr:hypothetical protein [Gemmataceae bacterium]MDW8244898.1 hypothetical protein [Thermogemmata sp.]
MNSPQSIKQFMIRHQRLLGISDDDVNHSTVAWEVIMGATTFFEMKIIDLFQFGDGRTVLVGNVGTDVPFISACPCELLVDGVPVTTIRIEDEMLPNPRHEAGFRSVSTTSAVELNRDLLKHADCRLRMVDA